MGVPAVTGAAVAVDLDAGELTIDGQVFTSRRQDRDRRLRGHGRRGRARRSSSPRSTSASTRCSSGPTSCAGWGCAPTPTRPRDAARARELGAEGIGLCRTEHMFMAEDRQPKMRAMIMADDREGRRAALRELLPLQQEDFEGIFEAMQGLPVTIRLLDPPLHEFLPNLPELRAQVERARIEVTDDLDELEQLLDAGRGDPRGQPDARHARRPARDPVPRDLRDAGPRDHARGQGGRRAAASRDHDPARRLRARARDRPRAGRGASATSTACASARTTRSGR